MSRTPMGIPLSCRSRTVPPLRFSGCVWDERRASPGWQNTRLDAAAPWVGLGTLDWGTTEEVRPDRRRDPDPAGPGARKREPDRTG